MATILLMGHGSRDSAGDAEFTEVVRAVAARAPRDRVEGCVLEFPGAETPSIPWAIERCAARGDAPIFAIPMLLHHAGHSISDIPGLLDRARQQHTGLDLRTIPFLGHDESLLEIVEERIGEAHWPALLAAADESAILLVARGSFHPEANADFLRLGRLLWERNPFGLVESAFISLARPGVPEGIARCVQLGARRILVIPYFLNTGILVNRIGQQAAAQCAGYPGVEIAVGRHLGVHPKLVDLVLAHARALDGEASLTSRFA